jgi:hypothetical protein
MAKMSKETRQMYEDQIKEDLMKKVKGPKLKKKTPTRKRAPRKTLVAAKDVEYFDMVAKTLKRVIEDKGNRVPGTAFMPETAFKQTLRIIADRGEEDKKELIAFYNSVFANKNTLIDRLFDRVTQLKQEEKAIARAARSSDSPDEDEED